MQLIRPPPGLMSARLCPQVVAWMVVWPYNLCTGSWLDRRPGYPLLSVIIAMAFVHGLWWCWLWEENDDISSASERERKSAVTNCTPTTPIDWVIRYKNTTIGDISGHQRWQGIRMIFISWQITRNSSWTNLSELKCLIFHILQSVSWELSKNRRKLMKISQLLKFSNLRWTGFKYTYNISTAFIDSIKCGKEC